VNGLRKKTCAPTQSERAGATAVKASRYHGSLQRRPMITQSADGPAGQLWSSLGGVAGMDHLAPPMAEDQPMYEAMVTNMWLAAHTETVTLSSLVLCDAFRHPAMLAREAVAIDHASGGRYELGLGWGSVPAEFEVYALTDGLRNSGSNARPVSPIINAEGSFRFSRGFRLGPALAICCCRLARDFGLAKGIGSRHPGARVSRERLSYGLGRTRPRAVVRDSPD